nr:RhuM family protein [Treponema denticola]
MDLFASSIDYNANTEEAKLFFATVQNKMHYAIHNHTAAELIYGRVDSERTK